MHSNYGRRWVFLQCTRCGECCLLKQMPWWDRCEAKTAQGKSERMHHRRRATPGLTEAWAMNQAAQPSSPSLCAPPSSCRSCRPVASI